LNKQQCDGLLFNFVSSVQRCARVLYEETSSLYFAADCYAAGAGVVDDVGDVVTVKLVRTRSNLFLFIFYSRRKESLEPNCKLSLVCRVL